MKQCNKCGEVKSNYFTVFDKRRGTSREERICKDCKYQITREWRKKNRDKCNLQNRKWVKNNREKYNEVQRNTYRKYIEKRREYGRDLYHKLSKKYGWSLNTLSRNGGLETVRAVYEKYHNQCSNCGAESDLHIHHLDNQGRHNLARGLKPNNSINNLIILCVSCHTSRHQHEKQYGQKVKSL